jgi:cyclic 2,3-diphosphoglycerate synthetase
MRAVALIDGEHSPDVVREALRDLPYEWLGAILIGGTEKLRESEGYGVPLVEGFGGAEALVDLSDEPVMRPDDRLRWASRALAAGLSYHGADFRFDPPAYEPFERPAVAVIGTGKRVGKTAVSAHLAGLLSRTRDVVVVTMGRGGPPEPELIESPPDVAALVALSRSGRHAASDHLEIAAVAGVTTIGCRRAGGGLAGRPFVSNVVEGARLAAARAPDVVVFDGSGTAIPPVSAARRVLVAGPGADLDVGFGLYRLLVSDLVVALGHDRPGAIRADLRLRPLEELPGRVAVFAAGPAETSHLEADVVHVSCSLGDRDTLQRELAALDADTYLTELKGAAIELVAEDALARGRRVVLAANDVVGEGLDEALLALAPEAVTTG